MALIRKTRPGGISRIMLPIYHRMILPDNFNRKLAFIFDCTINHLLNTNYYELIKVKFFCSNFAFCFCL